MPQRDRPHTARTQTYSREYGIGGAIPSPRWSKGAVGLTLLATAALIAILGALMAWRMTIEAVDRTRDVIQHAQYFWAFLADVEMAQRGFVLTGEERDLDSYRQALPGLESEVQALRSLTAGNPGQQHRVERLDSATRHRLGELAQTIQLRRAGGEDAAIRMVRSGRGRADMEEVRSVLSEIEAEENTLLGDRIQRRKESLTLMSGFAFACAILGLAPLIAGRRSRLRLQRSMRERERQYRTLADSMPLLCWMANRDGWIFWYNQRWYDYTGSTPEQMAGWGWQSVHDPATLPAVLERWKRSIQTGDPFEMTFPLRGADGVFRSFLTRIVPVRDDSGQIVRWFGTNTEIEEHQRAEQALRETEERLRLAQQVAQVGTFEWDIRTGVNRWTPEMEALYGLPQGGFAGTLKAWEDLVHPDDLKAALEKLETALKSGGFESEWRVARSGANPRWLAARAWVFFDDAGKPVRMVGANIDITQRKLSEQALRESEERYSSLAETLPAIIYTTSPQGDVTYVNRRWEEYTGARLDCEGESPVHPDDRKAVEFQWHEALKTETTYEVEFRLRRADGVYRWFRSRAVPLRNDEGQVVRWLGFTTDTEDEKRSEERLLQMQKMEATGRLAGGVAHDFNNLLTAITGYNDLLLASLGPGSKQFEFAREVQGAAQRAGDLTRQLLAFGRRGISKPKVLNLNEAVLSVRGLLSRVIGEDIEIATNLQSDLWSTRVDPGQFDQVIVNLAVNARDAMAGGGRLTFETANARISAAQARKMQSNPGDYVVLRVRDTGVGMDREIRRRLFEPFFTTKEEGKGTGLGSSIVYGIVQQHGGFIAVDSEPGKGSTFSIHFPRVRNQVEAAELPKEAIAPSGANHGHTVLLVEDENSVRELAATLLRGKGYRVVEAPTPADAIEFVRDTPDSIDLLLTDVLMPGMRGNELAKRVRELRPGVPVLYMSGYSDSTFLSPGALQGGVFLQKPFTVSQLMQAIEKSMQGVENH